MTTEPVWAFVELMGHRTRVGTISEHEQFGAPMLRLEIDGNPDIVELYTSSAIFSIRLLTEDAARQLIGRRSTGPVMQLAAGADDEWDDDDPAPF